MGWLNPRKLAPGARHLICRLAYFAIPASATIVGCLIALLCLGHIAPAQAADPAVLSQGALAQASGTETTAPVLRLGQGFSGFANFEARYSAWRGSRGVNVFDPAPGKGNQFYAPMTFGLDYESAGNYRLQTRVKSGYVNSNNLTPGQVASLSTMVDTQVTTTFTYLGAETYRWFAGVAVNAPTGTTYLPNNLRFTRMDPDLVDVGSYGAGWNFNPTSGVVFAVDQNTAVSVSAGYAWQGPFYREGIAAGNAPQCATLVRPEGLCFESGGEPTFDAKRNVNPGNVFTANANTSSIWGNVAVKTSFAFMSETDVKLDGIVVGRTGAKFVTNGEISYRIDPQLGVALNASYTYTQRNKIVGPLGNTVTEPKDSNGDVFIGSIGPTYAFSERLSATANYSILWRRHNYYDFIENQYIPAKLKQSVGGILNYAVSPTSSIGLRGSYFWVNEYTGPSLPTEVDCSNGSFLTCGTPVVRGRTSVPPAINYTGWTAGLSGRIQF